MKILEIQDAEIAKIENQDPIILSKIKNNVSYEWFYLEINKEDLHVILILSLKDCFEIKNTNSFENSSIYFTCYYKNKIVGYSYSFFEGNEENEFKEKIFKWFNLESPSLELWFPDHSLKKYIQLSIDYPRDISCIKTNKDIDLGSNKKHFWQFISYKNNANGFIKIFDLSPKFDLTNICKRKSNFYDFPLSIKLSKRNTNLYKFENANLYFDHNAGFESLYTIKDNWYWWHARNKNEYEVNYFFPHIEKMFHIGFINNELTSKIHSISKKELILKNSNTFFGLSYPKKINSIAFNEIQFNKTIESAPFYYRAKSVDNILSTIEVLNPRRIINDWNQKLLYSRKIHILKNISRESEISSYLNFSKICKKITWSHGKSFYISSLVLPIEQRNSSYFIYTLCRLIDDATDENILLNEPGSKFSTQLLNVFWSDDIEILDDFIPLLIKNISLSLYSVINYDAALDFIMNSRLLIKNLSLEKVYFEDLISGQLMDEHFSQPLNISDFNLYCYRVAGVVGIMMSKIFRTQKSPIALNAAEKLGSAMQITNILRDVKEDYDKKRIYIPISLFQKHKIENSLDFFSNELNKQNKIEIIKDLSDIAILYYCESLEGIKYIPSFRARLCVKLMVAVYGSILGKILIDKSVIFKKRIVISHFKKMIIFLKVVIGFHPLKVAKLISKEELL